jgi:hypothetical protein
MELSRLALRRKSIASWPRKQSENFFSTTRCVLRTIFSFMRSSTSAISEARTTLPVRRSPSLPPELRCSSLWSPDEGNGSSGAAGWSGCGGRWLGVGEPGADREPATEDMDAAAVAAAAAAVLASEAMGDPSMLSWCAKGLSGPLSVRPAVRGERGVGCVGGDVESVRAATAALKPPLGVAGRSGVCELRLLSPELSSAADSRVEVRGAGTGRARLLVVLELLSVRAAGVLGAALPSECAVVGAMWSRLASGSAECVRRAGCGLRARLGPLALVSVVRASVGGTRGTVDTTAVSSDKDVIGEEESGLAVWTWGASVGAGVGGTEASRPLCGKIECSGMVL